jgi:hypothetical protein
MQVYQTDPNGYFVYPVLADADPLDEGQWLIPAGCVMSAPPTIPVGFKARWTGQSWTLEDASTGIVVGPGGPTPQQLRAGMSLSFAQLLSGLVAEAWITEAEGNAWLLGVPPAPVEALIASLPADQRFLARARAVKAMTVQRLDPLVVALGAMQGKTDDELDDFFTNYAQV